MAKFMLLYRGDATPMDQISEADSVTINEQWTAWIGKHGSSLVDVGTPFGARASVGGDGSEQQPAMLQGYTVVEAGSLEEARSFTEGHPFLHGTGADFAIDVFELVPIEM